MATVHIRISTEGHTTCSLELLTAYFQPANSVFLSQQTSQQYFQPLIFSQDDRDRELHARVHELALRTELCLAGRMPMAFAFPFAVSFVHCLSSVRARNRKCVSHACVHCDLELKMMSGVAWIGFTCPVAVARMM
jgi:hypothetical protein